MASVVVRNPLQNIKLGPRTFRHDPRTFKRGTETFRKSGRHNGQRNLFHPRRPNPTINFSAQPIAPVEKRFRWSNGQTNGPLGPTGMGLTYEPYNWRNPVSYNRRSVPQSTSNVIEENKRGFFNFMRGKSRKNRKSRKSRRGNTRRN